MQVYIYMYGPHMWSVIILYWPPPPSRKLIHNNQISVLAGTVSRKIFNTRDSTVDSIPYDHDENKYQRRGAIDWFTRWFWWVLNPSWLQVIAANHLMSAWASVMTFVLRAGIYHVHFILIDSFYFFIFLFSGLGELESRVRRIQTRH